MIDFVQLGANIGNVNNDLIWRLAKENDWYGLLVEPHPKAFKKLKENYSYADRFIFENVAIYVYDGIAPFYLDPGYGHSGMQSSVNKDHWKGRLTANITVPCMRLMSLLEKHGLIGKDFKMLQMDIEGMDCRVLLDTYFSLVRPEYIMFEVVHDRGAYSEVMDHMVQYERIWNDWVGDYDVLLQRI